MTGAPSPLFWTVVLTDHSAIYAPLASTFALTATTSGAANWPPFAPPPGGRREADEDRMLEDTVR